MTHKTATLYYTHIIVVHTIRKEGTMQNAVQCTARYNYTNYDNLIIWDEYFKSSNCVLFGQSLCVAGCVRAAKSPHIFSCSITVCEKYCFCEFVCYSQNGMALQKLTILYPFDGRSSVCFVCDTTGAREVACANNLKKR